MQTFLPFPEFDKSCAVLDYKRLGKQRVECKQLLKALGQYPEGLMKPEEKPSSGGWAKHPAATMWQGYEAALAMYHNEAILAWVSRGYRNTMPLIDIEAWIAPPWLGDPLFHASHRSNLIRKDPAYYRDQLGWTEPDDMEYVWP